MERPGTININIPADSRQWLFDAPLDHSCLWSLGRFRPACDIGDDILFRFDGAVAARAIVREVLKPAENNTVSHNGERNLRGWKVVWYARDLEQDMHDFDAPLFGAPLTERMQRVLESADESGVIPYGQHDGLVRRGLVEVDDVMATAMLAREGWRWRLRRIDDARRLDIENGNDVCEFCGCTWNCTCEGGCAWYRESLCTSCVDIVGAAMGVSF